jgi:hypothetical protein
MGELIGNVLGLDTRNQLVCLAQGRVRRSAGAGVPHEFTLMDQRRGHIRHRTYQMMHADDDRRAVYGMRIPLFLLDDGLGGRPEHPSAERCPSDRLAKS